MQTHVSGEITKKICPVKETNLLKPGVERLPSYQVYVINIPFQGKLPNITFVQ